ncbi:MAG: hypothetical protein HZB65_02210 [Candidatus Aenigmarchaeota archaeon]|nr:hypothetical protein [Candidatus Aenigmarchaeota archaeon]
MLNLCKKELQFLLHENSCEYLDDSNQLFSYLCIYPESSMRELIDNLANDAKRIICSSFHELFLEKKTRRINIPDEYLRCAGIESKAAIIGADNHFELWNPKNFEEYKNHKTYKNKMTFSESHSSCQGKKYYTFHYNKKE